MPLNFPDTPANNEIYTYNGSSFIYTGSYWESLSYPSNIYSKNVFTATEGQTEFTVSYTVGYVDVWLNGVKLIITDDYTATDGTTVTLVTGATAGDDVDIVSWLPSSTQNGYYIDTVFNGTFANSTFTGNSYFANTVTVQAISANGTIGTDGQVLTSNGTIAYWSSIIAAGQASVDAPATTGTLTINSDIADIYVAEGLTGNVTIDTPSGSPNNGKKLLIRLKDDGTARTITWTTSAGAFREIGVTLPTTTVINKTTYVGCIYNSADSYWDVIATTTQA